jgi:hypothetical protein
LIDLAKAQLPPERLRWFLLDQALYLLVLATLWLAWVGSQAPLAALGAWLGLGLLVRMLVMEN